MAMYNVAGKRSLWLTAALVLVLFSTVTATPARGLTLSVESDSAFMWITITGSTCAVKIEGEYIFSDDDSASLSVEELACAWDDNSGTVTNAVDEKVETILKRTDSKVTGISGFSMSLEKGDTKVKFRIEFNVNGVVNGREISLLWRSFKAEDSTAHDDKIHLRNMGGADHNHDFNLFNCLMMDWSAFDDALTDSDDWEVTTTGSTLILQADGSLDAEGWGTSDWDMDVKITVNSGQGSTINTNTIDLPAPAGSSVSASPDLYGWFIQNWYWVVGVLVAFGLVWPNRKKIPVVKKVFR